MPKIDGPSQQPQVQSRPTAPSKAPAGPTKISGQQAAGNLAGMLASQEMAPNILGNSTTAQTSLLGIKGEAQNSAMAQNPAFQSFTFAALGLVEPRQEALTESINVPTPRGELDNETKQALGKALFKMEGQQLARAQSLAAAAVVVLEKNPQVQEAAAKASQAANNLGKADSKQDTGKESAANVNGADGKVFQNFVSVAGQAAQAQGLDITKMPIEDAMVYMMMICSKDARDDLMDMVKVMEGTRKRRAAIREATTLLKEQQQEIKEQLRKEYTSMSAEEQAKVKFEDWVGSVEIKMPQITIDYENGTASIAGSATKEGGEVLSLASAAPKGQPAETIGGEVMKFSSLESQMDDLNNKKDALADISQEQQLKMQMVMERMTKMDQMASNLSKKINDTIMSIVGNLK